MKIQFKNKIIITLLSINCFLYAQLELQNQFCDLETCNVYTDDIYAVWWDDQYDFQSDAEIIINTLVSIRTICLQEFGMEDPPNPTDGYYYNVYLGYWQNDLFPDGWALGQGTDIYGYPYLTLPFGTHLESIYMLHEGFHIFQYNSNSSGFSYSGDSGWYIEASANWFVSIQEPDNLLGFLESAAISANPQLPIWYGFFNSEANDPQNWQRGVLPYAMNTFLYYLTDVVGMDEYQISNSFYQNIIEYPQEYLSNYFGFDEFKEIFSDWTMHNVAGFDYISEEQWNRAQIELDNYGDPNDLNPYIEIFNNSGTDGIWLRPNQDYTTRSWGYNVYKIHNSENNSYGFYLKGDNQGNMGTNSIFNGRIVSINNGSTTFHNINMANNLNGSIVLDNLINQNEIYFVIASVPQNYSGNETFSYEIFINAGQLFGDINLDDNVNILDVVYIVNLILDSQYILLADVNTDDIINILDVIIIINQILNN